jgi:predicted DNA-binding transcriptional regulator AlpA
MYRENIEKMFKDDIREKKKAGNGVHSRRGKGVKHGLSGALRTSSYYMSNKEKKKLSGEVTVSNMYENIIPIEEFELKDIETQKLMLIRWREIHDNSTIRSQMKLNNSQFYDLVNDLKIPKKSKTGGRVAKSKAKVDKPKQTKAIAIEPVQQEINLQPSWSATPTNTLEFVEPPYKLVQPIPEPTNGLNLQYNGEYTAEQLVKLFTKLQLITEGEENKFKLAINLIELE